MKSFLLFLCLAAAEKLDRTYLPPPGAKFSGGAPGDIQAPFEIPKETFSTTLRPDVYNKGALSPEDTRIEVGINRGVPLRPGASGNVSPGSQDQDYQTYKVPTTTTSYAFTTTTTHPPGEAYETTNGSINPVTGLPTTTFEYPTSAPGFLNPAVYNPGNLPVTFQQGQVPDRVPSGRPTQYPATTTLAPGQFIGQSRPGFNQGNNFEHFPNQRPSVIPGLVQRPISGVTQNQYQGQQYPINVPGIEQQNSLVPSTFAPGTFAPTTFAPGTTPNSIQYGGDLDQGVISNQNPPFAQGNIPAGSSDGALGSYYPGQNQPQYVAPGQQLPQGVSQTSSSQQYPTSQTDEFGRPVVQNNVYQPFSTVSPTTPIPNLGQLPSSTPGSQPSATTVYPSGSFPTTSGSVGSAGIQTGLISRPERPQAEADRNAVILNYENVITPEGFAYSFDTSNGIHADESGTAVDGVRAKGSYSYIGDDGKLYSVVYTADENGFQPRGDHLPTSPPIPEAILKVIEQAKKDQDAGVSDDGTYDEDKYGHTKYESGRYRPQRPNKINVYDEVHDRDDGQFDQSDRRQEHKPQKETKRPVSANQDYEDIGEKQSQEDGSNVVDFNQKRPNNQTPSRFPANHIHEESNGQYNPEITLDEGSGDGFTSDKISPQYQTIQPVNDRRQFGDKFSVQRPGQFSESESDVLTPEQVNSLVENHPDYITSQDNYHAGGSQRRPVDSQPTQRPGIVSNYSQTSGRRPQHDSTQRPAGSADSYERPVSETSSQVSGQYPNEAGVSSIPINAQGQYGNRLRPITSTLPPDDGTDIYDYQDSRRPGGIDKYLPNKGHTNQPVSSSTTIAPISNQYSGSSVDDNKLLGIEDGSGKRYNSPSDRLPSRIPGSNLYDSTGSQISTTGRPAINDVTYNQFSSSQRKPQSSTTPAPQQGNEYYGNRIIEPTRNQNGRRPVPGRRPSEATRYTTITPIKEEGYQYLPPQRKFDLGSRRPGGSQVIPSYGKPSEDRTYNEGGEVPKPFITPDATRPEEGSENDHDYDNYPGNNQYRRPQYNQVQPSQRPGTTQQQYQSYDKENRLDNYDKTRPQGPGLTQNGLYGSKIDPTPISGENGITTVIGSTRRPPYQQNQTTRPQQYRPGSVYETTQSVPSSTMRPQEINRFVTSTSVPSQSTRFEVTQPSTLPPGQQTTDRYNGRGQKPSTQGYFTQTTKLPAQTPDQYNVRPTQNIYEQTSSLSPYQTTYRPMVTYSGLDSDEAPGTTIRPGRPFGRPGHSQNQVPSTTYRPAFYPSQVTEKQVTVDNYGRPLSQQQSGGEYRPGTTVTSENTVSPGSRRPVQGLRPLDMYGRPTGPAQGNVPSYAGPEGSSTTEKIIGEDFSGPKQQQRFDPERGYYY